MSRRNKSRSKSRRFRIERLETRQMLSADGFGVDCVRDEFGEQWSRSSRGYEMDLSRVESDRHRQQDSRDALDQGRDRFESRSKDWDRSQRGSGRHQKHDWQFDRVQVDEIPLDSSTLRSTSSAESEFVSRSVVDPQSRRPEPEIRVLPAIEVSVVFVILPITATRTTLDPVSSLSAPQTSRSELASRSSTADAPSIVSVVSERAQRSPTDRTEAGSSQGAEQADTVQLVSVSHRDVHSVSPAAGDATTIELKKIAGAVPTFGLPETPFRFDDTPSDPWFERSGMIGDELSRLDELLDAIASERTKRSFPASPIQESVARSEQSSIAANFAADLAPTPSGMILLMPGTSAADQAFQISAQVFDEIDDSEVAQWTVGVGVYHALEIAGNDQLAKALIIASDVASEAMNAGTQIVQVDDANPSVQVSESASSTRQAAGVVFCCIGIQYLKNRRKQSIGKATELQIVSRDA